MTPATSADVRRRSWRTRRRSPTLPSQLCDQPASAVPAPGSALPVTVPPVSAAPAEPTLGALATEALRLLRRRLGRPRRRSPRSPRLAVTDRLVPYRLVLLALTAVLSLTVSWVVSTAALDHRVQLAAGGQPGVSPVEVSLEQRSGPRRLVADVGGSSGGHRARSGQPGTVRAGVERAGASPPAGGGGLEIGGPVLALATGGGTLGAGALVGLLVLRRPRRPSAAVDDAVESTDSSDGAEDCRPEPGEERAKDERSTAEPAPSLPPEHEAVADGAPDGAEDTDADHPRPDQTHAHPSSAAVQQQADPSADGEVAAVERQTPVPAQRVPLLAQDEGLDPALAAARQRLYEKRRAPRIPVDLAGQLTWLGSAWPVTVVEISEGGLRLSAPGRPSVDGRRSPLSAADHVRLSLTGLSGEVRLAGRLAWQRNGPAGFQAGVQLITPSGEDLERLQELCTVAALTASPRQG